MIEPSTKGELERKPRRFDMTCPEMPGSSYHNYWIAGCLQRQRNGGCKGTKCKVGLELLAKHFPGRKEPEAKTDPVPVEKKRVDRACSADGCTSPARVRGLCWKHHARAKRSDRVCAEPGCKEVVTRPRVRRCDLHLVKMHTCRYPGCTAQITGHAKLCDTHRQQGQPALSKLRSEVAAPGDPEAGRPADYTLVFSGEDAEVLRRFEMESVTSGGTPNEDVATLVALFMSGDLRVKTVRGRRRSSTPATKGEWR